MHTQSTAERGCPFSSQGVTLTSLTSTLVDVLYPPLAPGVLQAGTSLLLGGNGFLSAAAALRLQLQTYPWHDNISLLTDLQGACFRHSHSAFPLKRVTSLSCNSSCLGRVG